MDIPLKIWTFFLGISYTSNFNKNMECFSTWVHTKRIHVSSIFNSHSVSKTWIYFINPALKQSSKWNDNVVHHHCWPRGLSVWGSRPQGQKHFIQRHGMSWLKVKAQKGKATEWSLLSNFFLPQNKFFKSCTLGSIHAWIHSKLPEFRLGLKYLKQYRNMDTVQQMWSFSYFSFSSIFLHHMFKFPNITWIECKHNLEKYSIIFSFFPPEHTWQSKTHISVKTGMSFFSGDRELIHVLNAEIQVTEHIWLNNVLLLGACTPHPHLHPASPTHNEAHWIFYVFFLHFSVIMQANCLLHHKFKRKIYSLFLPRTVFQKFLENIKDVFLLLKILTMPCRIGTERIVGLFSEGKRGGVCYTIGQLVGGWWRAQEPA